MEIQIPLVIFTSFLAWAAGIFGTQCILALQKRGGAVQLPALICSAVVLVVGGIAVVFHLTHPFNLFKGFGHITSGITQELIAIVLLAVAGPMTQAAPSSDSSCSTVSQAGSDGIM